MGSSSYEYEFVRTSGIWDRRSWDRDPCRVLLTRDSRIDANARTVTALDARVYVCPVEPRMVRNEEYANYNPAGAVVYPAVNGKCDS